MLAHSQKHKVTARAKILQYPSRDIGLMVLESFVFCCSFAVFLTLFMRFCLPNIPFPFFHTILCTVFLMTRAMVARGLVVCVVLCFQLLSEQRRKQSKIVSCFPLESCKGLKRCPKIVITFINRFYLFGRPFFPFPSPKASTHCWSVLVFFSNSGLSISFSTWVGALMRLLRWLLNDLSDRYDLFTT